ncbi:hypothetical protein F5878DRAFT_707110 [Lentinula raphanica]|uniref:DUF6534 domain-containing protein n=1 Tax=Lentinula raphanica TaxID=153919 RepID=A0AA38PHZ9_9AGAR|nr:hypothetical protein F5878DRAFT_707110 [Lentinula raphanica]
MTLDATLGMFEIGILIAGVLFGLITAQVYIHHKTFPDESKWIKYGLVTTIWLLDMGHTICAFHVIYFYTVIHYGDYSSLEAMPDSMPVLTVIQGITIIIVQGYFTYRIWRLTGKPYIPAFIFFIMLCQLVASMAISSQVAIVSTKNLAKFMKDWKWLYMVLLFLRASTDLMISGILVYYLVKSRRSAMRRTVAIIDKCILWAIETGIVTSIVGFLSVIFFLASSTTLTPKVFTNTMLANMNSRAILQNMHSSQTSGRSTSGDPNYPGIALQLASPRSPRPVNIAVHTEVQIQEDAERQWPLPGSEPESVLEMDSETQKSGYMAY